MANSVGSTATQERSSSPELLDVEAVAKLLSCSTRTVRRMADSGQMPRPLKVASLVRWRRSDIEQWLADGCPSCRPSQRRASR
ncbi:MAG: helix-turn-helix domain-containing protein [Rhodopirellula sp.]|nr:helix-turn-helix domain-containing protein [Rhodopirellula sp.]